MTSLRLSLRKIVMENQPMTVRQVFYQAVSKGLIEKSEAEYQGTIIRLLTELRLKKDGFQIPFHWITDSTRWQRKPMSFASLGDALAFTQQTYRRSLWNEQEIYVEIWLEKEALAGVFYEETGKWDVPLMVTRGYPSISYLHEAAEFIRTVRKPTHLYYFGDHDPSGLDIPRVVEARLREFAPGADIHFECVAVMPDQIRDWNLPSRPTKKTDTRSKKFNGESVEVDAIPPARLRELAKKCIEKHLDWQILKRTRLIEEAERKSLMAIIDSTSGESGDDRR